MGIAAEMF